VASATAERGWIDAVARVFISASNALRLSWALFWISIFTAVTNAYLNILLTTLSIVFGRQYNFSTQQVGLPYLALSIGGGLGIILVGLLSDLTVSRLSLTPGKAVKPERRLGPAVICGFIMPLGLLIFGWSADRKLHWIVPALGVFLFTLGCLGSQVSNDKVMSPCCADCCITSGRGTLVHRGQVPGVRLLSLGGEFGHTVCFQRFDPASWNKAVLFSWTWVGQ